MQIYKIKYFEHSAKKEEHDFMIAFKVCLRILKENTQVHDV